MLGSRTPDGMGLRCVQTGDRGHAPELANAAQLRRRQRLHSRRAVSLPVVQHGVRKRCGLRRRCALLRCGPRRCMRAPARQCLHRHCGLPGAHPVHVRALHDRVRGGQRHAVPARADLQQWTLRRRRFGRRNRVRWKQRGCVGEPGVGGRCGHIDAVGLCSCWRRSHCQRLVRRQWRGGCERLRRGGCERLRCGGRQWFARRQRRGRRGRCTRGSGVRQHRALHGRRRRGLRLVRREQRRTALPVLVQRRRMHRFVRARNAALSRSGAPTVRRHRQLHTPRDLQQPVHDASLREWLQGWRAPMQRRHAAALQRGPVCSKPDLSVHL